MPKNAEGELRETEDGFAARITIRGKHRKTFPLPTCRTRDEAIARRNLLAELAQRFRKAGVIDSTDARTLLETAASCAPGLLAGVRQVAGELVGGELTDADAPSVPTFKEVAKDWTDGTLHTRHPDHVKAKDSELDAARLAELAKIDVGGIALGDVPLDRFTLDHAEAAMRKLPARAKRPATRRQYAQLINRVLALAVYPCRILKVNPLPRGFMPKTGKPPAFPYLYPDEDRKLLEHAAIPLGRRVLWGFLTREGCRSGEAVALRLGFEVDLERGVVRLDRNKTDDARAWALDASVAAALRAYVKLRGAERGAWLFVDEDGEQVDNAKLAEQLRDDLEAAGIDRPELHADGENTRKLRVHDLRGTFVTMALANGKTEAWVQDRTGHTTSAMLNRYRRAARSASELGLGPPGPLAETIPELRLPLDCPAAENGGPDDETQLSRIILKAEVAEPADAADSKGERHQGNRGTSGDSAGRASAPERPHSIAGQSRGNESAPDAVEIALATALQQAAAAGAWDAVTQLARELEARRRARGEVVSLEAERAKRGTPPAGTR